MGLWDWMSWLEEADYDVWLIMMEYVKPIIQRTFAHNEIRYLDNPIFKKVAKRMHADNRRYAYLSPEIPIYSVSYLRWYQGKFDVRCPYQTNEVFRGSWGDVEIYGLTWYSSTNDYKQNNIRDTKDKVIEHMKLNEIDYKKSWTKQKLMKAVLKHPIVEHSRVLDRFK